MSRAYITVVGPQQEKHLVPAYAALVAGQKAEVTDAHEAFWKDVNHHAFAIDVADFQVCQFSASYSGGVERHQQGAMEGSAGGLNELSNFFLAEDRWQAMGSFRIGSVGDAPSSLERLTVKEP